MSFVRFSPLEHKIDSSDYKIVEQDIAYCEVLSQSEERPLFLAEGLNPCLGIAMHGISQTDDEDEEPDVFVIFYHCAGLTSENLRKITEGEEGKDVVVNDFCKNSISNMLSRLDQWFDNNDMYLEKITITGSNLIRCSQSDAQNIQEDVANEFKRILSSPNEINDLIEEDGSIEAEIQFENYNFQLLEEPEKYEDNDKKTGETDSIHVFLSSTKEGLKIIYYKGFETVKKLLEEKTEQKIEMPMPSISTPSPLGSGQTRTQSPRQANTASIGRLLFESQASNALRPETPNLNSPALTESTIPIVSSSTSTQDSSVSPTASEQVESEKQSSSLFNRK